jgi:hypothetical protein
VFFRKDVTPFPLLFQVFCVWYLTKYQPPAEGGKTAVTGTKPRGSAQGNYL